MKYTVWLFDGTYYVVDEGSYRKGIAEVEAAMIGKKAVDLCGTLVTGSAISKIEPFGNREETNVQISTGFSEAIHLLEAKGAQAVKDMGGRIEEAKESIRGTLDAISDLNKKKRELVAARKLAERLYTKEERKTWRLATWERFNAEHPNPIRELERLETAQNEL